MFVKATAARFFSARSRTSCKSFGKYGRCLRIHLLPRCSLVPAVARQLLSQDSRCCALHVKFPAGVKLFASGNVLDKLCTASVDSKAARQQVTRKSPLWPPPVCRGSVRQATGCLIVPLETACLRSLLCQANNDHQFHCFPDAGLFRMMCSMWGQRTPAPGGYANILRRSSVVVRRQLELCVRFNTTPRSLGIPAHDITRFLIDLSQTCCWLLDDINTFEVNCFQDCAFCQKRGSM